MHTGLAPLSGLLRPAQDGHFRHPRTIAQHIGDRDADAAPWFRNQWQQWDPDQGRRAGHSDRDNLSWVILYNAYAPWESARFEVVKRRLAYGSRLISPC